MDRREFLTATAAAAATAMIPDVVAAAAPAAIPVPVSDVAEARALGRGWRIVQIKELPNYCELALQGNRPDDRAFLTICRSPGWSTGFAVGDLLDFVV